MKKKPVVVSSHCLRFYESDGWTKEELDKCCVKGEVHCAHPEDEDPYLTLNGDVGSCFDIKKLKARISKVERCFRDQESMTDDEILEEYNW